MLYKHITDSTTVRPYTLLAPAHTALADILYKNGENGPSEGGDGGFSGSHQTLFGLRLFPFFFFLFFWPPFSDL